MYTIKCQFNTMFLVENEQKEILLCTQNLKKKRKEKKRHSKHLFKMFNMFIIYQSNCAN